MSRFLSNIFALLFAVTLPAIVNADVYTFVFTQDGAPVPAIKIHGTNGVDNLPARLSNSDGLWVFDSTDLDAREFPFSLPTDKKPYITFTKSNVRFDPPAITLPDDCPSFRCAVNVIGGKGEQAVLRWNAVNSNLTPEGGVPFTAQFALDAGPRETDSSGTAMFPVLRQTNCSNSDSNLDNNYTGVFPLDRAGLTCSYATTNSLKQLICPTASESASTNIVTCSNATAIPVGSSVTYEIRVRNEANADVPGVTFHGPQLGNLWDTATGFDGKWTFTTASLGVPAETPITIIPTGNRTFSHNQLVVSPNSCPRNICTIYAVNDGGKQGVLKLRVTKDGTALPDVSIESSDQGRGTRAFLSLTDSLGYSYLPTSPLPSCSSLDTSSRNDPILFSPSKTQCSFSDSSPTPFTLCPSTLVSDYTVTGACGAPGPSQLVISGLVSDISGKPLEGARVVAGNLGWIETDRTGKYALYFDEGTTPGLSVDMAPRIFDPAMISFDSIDTAHTGIDFRMIAPSLGSPLPTPTPPCSVEPTYTISGTVYDISGSPLSGVDILSNDVAVTTTNAQGKYSFSAPAALPQWITASHYFDGFDPAGVAFPLMICNQSLVDFIVTDNGSLVIGGNVVDRNFNSVPDVTIEITVGDAVIRTRTWSNGEYRAVVPVDEDYSVRAVFSEEIFTPETYSVTAGVPRLDLDFIAAGQIIPTPTPTPSSTATPTITGTPMPTATGLPSPSNSPTPSPTVTALPTSTVTATATSAPTSTPFPTSSQNPTFTPTNSATPAPSSTTPPTAQPTVTATIPQPTVTPSNAPTTQPTASPSSSPAPSPSFPGKEPICHDDEGVRQTIWVGISSVPYFLKDGDKKEDCGDDKPDPKVAVCHRTGDGSSHTIVISSNALEAHLKHGDYIGECGQPTPTPYPEDPTPSPTKAPTASPTGSPAPTATPTATPSLRLRLTSMCSVNPSNQLRWRVTNPFSIETSVMWQVYGTSFYGYLSVPAESIAYFYTTTVSDSPNTTRLFWNGAQVDVKAASFAQCDIENPTPTPTPAPTSTATSAPTSPPTAAPTSTVPPESENPVPTRSPEPTSTPLPSPTSTPTVSPSPPPDAPPTIKYAYITGEIRGRNGQVIRGALAKKLTEGFRIVGKSTTSDYTFTTQFTDTDNWRIGIPLDSYRITVEFLNKTLTIASRPMAFRVHLATEGEVQNGYFFATKGRRGTTPTSSTARVTKRRAGL